LPSLASGTKGQFELRVVVAGLERSGASWRISRTETINRFPLILGDQPERWVQAQAQQLECAALRQVLLELARGWP
jgi:hypothetical protein